MIRNHNQLALTRKQLERAEDALVSLHQRVYEKNPRNYTIFAESYIDMILQLRAEIDAFLGIGAPPPDDPEQPTNGAAHAPAESAAVGSPPPAE